ncbi:hypothetical protein GCM10011369_15700 [Neiella marina]|uniref:Positive regulator of sigma(E), RseC/MucC n=1 Tax=Neiella marina TaxID=508461 RepID=A0A8J2U4G2_9GAMM|nr:SoxR reducing system RseC family protein [Neiella marina]GGA74734.1 hypothetical protein GCM10011369_15700 [Neiella marina]
MIETIATVVDYHGGQVTVEALRRSSCEQCTDKDCGNGQVNRALSNRYHRLTLPYNAPLKVGEQVVLALPEQGLLTAAGLMFVVPLVAILVGAGVGNWLFVGLLNQTELMVVLSALLFGAAGFVGARWWHSKIQKHQWFEPHIKRRHQPVDGLTVDC